MDKCGGNKKFIIAQGSWGTIECALTSKGKSKIHNDLEKLREKDFTSYARILTLLKSFAQRGKIIDKTKFKQLKNGIYEFKRHPYRIGCFLAPKKCILTHIFDKKSDSSKAYVQKQIDKAESIKQQHLKFEK